MADKLNRRDEIVRIASELFIKQGFQATSVREIAQAVGCTEAALYYHFKEGKQALLKAVVEMVLPQLMNVLEEAKECHSLADYIDRVSHHIVEVMSIQAPRFRWIVSDFARFGPEEQTFIHEKHQLLYRSIVEATQRFIPDAETAHELAWTTICICAGYMQLFHTLNLKSLPDAQKVTIRDLLMRILPVEGVMLT